METIMNTKMTIQSDGNLRPRLGRAARALSAGAAAVTLLAQTGAASAYNETTHVIMTRSATLRSGLNGGPIFAKLGYGSLLAERFPALAADTFGAGDLLSKSAEDLIALGAEHEDNL